MGQSTKGKLKNTNKKIAVSGTPDDMQAVKSEVTNIDENGSSDNHLDILLTNVDVNIQAVAKTNDQVWLKGFSVHVAAGRLGDIPQEIEHKVNEANFKRGYVLNIDIAEVRLLL